MRRLCGADSYGDSSVRGAARRRAGPAHARRARGLVCKLETERLKLGSRPVLRSTHGVYHSSRPVVGIARAADLPLGGSSSRSLYRAAVPAVRNHRNAHGAELNAFLEEPGRSVALAASKARAEKGQAVVRAHGGAVVANATDTGESVAMVTTAPQPTRFRERSPARSTSASSSEDPVSAGASSSSADACRGPRRPRGGGVPPARSDRQSRFR